MTVFAVMFESRRTNQTDDWYARVYIDYWCTLAEEVTVDEGWKVIEDLKMTKGRLDYLWVTDKVCSDFKK